MKRKFWSFLIGLSGFLVRISLLQIYIQPTELSVLVLVIGILLSIVSLWGNKKFVPKNTASKNFVS